jgi:predicted HicB family RNase H-like nuclease
MTTKNEESAHAFMIRCSAEESTAFKAAASKARLPLATWARATLMQYLDEQKKKEAGK